MTLTVKPHVRAVVALFAASAFCVMLSGCASSDNGQIDLIGAGRFDELVSQLERKAAVQPLSTADLHELCYGYSRIKRYAKLFTCLDTLESQASGGDRRSRLFAYGDVTPAIYVMRAEAEVDFGRNEDALRSAGHAIELLRLSLADDEDVEADALAIMTIAAQFAGNRSEAEADLAKLGRLQLHWTANDPYASQKVYALARSYLALGRYQQTIDTLARDHGYSLQVFFDNLMSGARLRGTSNWVWQDLPRAYMVAKSLKELKRTSEARVAYDNLLNEEQIQANGEIYWLILYDRGRIAEDDKDSARAIELYQRAIETFELQRASINTEANKIGFIGRKQEVYDRLIRLLLLAGQNRRAFEYVQRSKARAFIDTLAQRFTDPSLPKQDAGGGSAIEDYFQAELEAVVQIPVSASDSGRRRRVVTDQAAVRVAALAPAVASLVVGDVVKTADIARLLRPDETLVQYHVSTDGGSIWIIGPDGLLLEKPLNTEGLLDAVKQFRVEIERHDRPLSDNSRLLYERLIAPVVNDLKTPNLLIVPDGALYYLPFAALKDGKRYLIDRFGLRFMPVISRYEASKRLDANGPILVIGNPDTGSPSDDLMDAQIEATNIAKLMAPNSKLLVRGNATKTAFVNLAGKYSRIHIASHASFNARRPLDSYLKLAKDKQDDGVFTAGNFINLRFNLDLITLSACDTGFNSISVGRDVFGFNSALLMSGARNIVSSLWDVSDPATSALMQSFYRNLGHGKRDALRMAQIETRRLRPNPYYWASFYLTGLDP
ncbi:MAG: CHAT domain-containing protein [Burkholderiaceae bacterium]